MLVILPNITIDLNTIIAISEVKFIYTGAGYYHIGFYINYTQAPQTHYVYADYDPKTSVGPYTDDPEKVKELRILHKKLMNLWKKGKLVKNLTNAAKRKKRGTVS